MPFLYPCRRCKALQEGSMLPRDWPFEVVARWRALESQMLCPDCEQVPLPDIDD